MSDTDNTRPYELQADDPSLPGYIVHHHLEYMTKKVGVNETGAVIYVHWSEDVPCDYRPDNNIRSYQNRWQPSARCYRRIYYCGGWNYEGGNASKLRRTLERSERSRVKRELHGFTRLGIDADPDLLPSKSYRSSASWFD
jgi:hypothetical protein